MKRHDETTAGLPGGISCEQAHELFYDFAVCALCSEDMHALSLHEASCPTCGPEFKEWGKLRNALLDSKIAPATDFKGGVMERIRETRVEPATKHSIFRDIIRQHGWVRGLAAAAVILIMLTGATKLTAVEGLIAHLGKPATIAFNTYPSPATGQTKPIGQIKTQPAPVNVVVSSKPGISGNTSNGSGAANVSGKSAISGQPVSVIAKPTQSRPQTTNKQNINSVQVPEQFTLTNVPTVITTTTIKLNVNSTERAASAAMNIANGVGATLVSEESTQDSEHSSLLFLHFMVDPGQAGVFLDRLSTLGGVASEDSVNKDVSNAYSMDVERYQALEAQEAAAPENNSDQYASQIAMVQNELANWHDAAGKQIVMVWLMQ